MDKSNLLRQTDKVAEIAHLSKLGRLLKIPGRYIDAMLFWKLIYPINKKQRNVQANLFFGKKMHVALPASTDIFLTGGKSHPSEIKLARFMINVLKPGDHFLDVGANYGYFTLLAAEIVGQSGKVEAYEPAGPAFDILTKNATELYPALIKPHKEAIADAPGTLTFFEFPNLYSEYNSMDASQFRNEKWFIENKPAEVTVPARTIDAITGSHFSPAMIKIDVEGAEDKAIGGATQFLQNSNPWVVMEYLSDVRGNSAHANARQLLNNLGYVAHVLDKNGQPATCSDVEGYIEQNKLDSDNIAFRKPVSGKAGTFRL